MAYRIYCGGRGDRRELPACFCGVYDAFRVHLTVFTGRSHGVYLKRPHAQD